MSSAHSEVDSADVGDGALRGQKIYLQGLQLGGGEAGGLFREWDICLGGEPVWVL